MWGLNLGPNCSDFDPPRGGCTLIILLHPDADSDQRDAVRAALERLGLLLYLLGAYEAEIELDREWHGRGVDTACGVTARESDLDADSPRIATVTCRP